MHFLTGKLFVSLAVLGTVIFTSAFAQNSGQFLEKRQCPPDMVDAGIYCIDSTKNANTNWRDQALLCHSEGKKLCSQAQWTSACHNSNSLGITDFLSGSSEYYDGGYDLTYISGYYSLFWSLGGSGGTCDRKYYSTWACTNSANCYNGNSINVGDSNYSGRCCLPQ